MLLSAEQTRKLTAQPVLTRSFSRFIRKGLGTQTVPTSDESSSMLAELR